MLKFILSFLLIVSLTFKMMGQSPDLFVSFESFSSGDAINTEAAMYQMSKTNGTAVTFVMHATSAPHRIVTANSAGLLRPVTVNGTSYTNSTVTKEWEVSADNGVNTNYLAWQYISSRKVSMGMEITLTNWSAGIGNYYNPFGLDGGSTYSYFSIFDNSPITAQAETNSNVGASIIIPQNTKLWVTALFDSANSKTVYHFYNRTNMVLLGVSSGAIVANSTINQLRVGIADAHTKTTGTKYRIGNILLYTNGTVFPVWPGSSLQVATNLTREGVGAAITNSTDGDSIILPATNATWTAELTIAKNNLNIAGVSPGGLGTNETVITGDNGSTLFNTLKFTGNFNTLSNLFITGDGANDEITAIRNDGSYNRFTHLRITEVNVALYSTLPALMDNCVVMDVWRLLRAIPGNTFYNTYYPLAWDSTNQIAVIEDTLFFWTSAKNQTSSQAVISSQNGQASIIRHNYFSLDNASTDPAPWIDYHGDSPGLGRPGTSLQVYSNYVAFLAGSVSGQRAIDVRGSRSLIYSNRWVGATFDSDKGITYREEEPELSPNYLVNNSYVWENYHGGAGLTAMPINDDTNITAGVDYFTTALTPLLRVTYPHPLRNYIAPEVRSTFFEMRGRVFLRGKLTQ